MLAACSLGAAAGLAFAWLWLRVVPHAAHAGLWRAMAPLARDIVQVDDFAALLRLYRKLAALVSGYVGRNLAGLVLAGLPALLLIVLFKVDETLFIAAFALASLTAMLWPRRS